MCLNLSLTLLQLKDQETAINVVDCHGSSQVLKKVKLSLESKRPYMAVVDSDALIPKLSAHKLKQYGVRKFGNLMFIYIYSRLLTILNNFIK